MTETKKKAFIAHKANGILLTFANGNSISSIWGNWTHSDNFDKDIRNENGDIDFNRTYDQRIADGSNTVEIMVFCEPDILKFIIETYPDHYEGDDLFGHVPMDEWIGIITILNKNK